MPRPGQVGVGDSETECCVGCLYRLGGGGQVPAGDEVKSFNLWFHGSHPSMVSEESR
jgi:hypothetical protein